MTEHPCKDHTKRRIELFEAIALGHAPYHMKPRLLTPLVEAGLVVFAGHELRGYSRFGPIKVAKFIVPLSVRMQWFRWRQENAT